MNIVEMVENYEMLEEEYNDAEEKASTYEREYDAMTDIGYNEEDAYTHAMACAWSSYDDKMNEIEKEKQECDISNDNFVAKQLIKEFKTIEINTLMYRLSDWFGCYGDGTEVFTQPLFFMHDETELYDDMIEYDYIDKFYWDIKKDEYFIVKTEYYKKTPTIKSYNQKEFFEWLEKELSRFCWWDLEVTEELETIIQIIYPTYYHFNY